MNLRANNIFSIICLFFLQKNQNANLHSFMTKCGVSFSAPSRAPRLTWALSGHEGGKGGEGDSNQHGYWQGWGVKDVMHKHRRFTENIQVGRRRVICARILSRVYDLETGVFVS